jgi:hypothetical protein
LSTLYPPRREATWYSYTAPGPTPGTKPSKRPDWPRGRSEWRSFFQPFH